MTKTYINGITVTPCIRPFAGKNGITLYKESIKYLTALADVNVSPKTEGVFHFNYHFEVENGYTYFIRSGKEVDEGYHGYLDEEKFRVTGFFTLDVGNKKEYHVDVRAYDDFYVGRVWHLKTTNEEKMIISIK